MTRHAVAVLTALALTATAAPALARDGSLPPMPPLPHEPAVPDFGYDSYPEELDGGEWLEDCRAEYADEYREEEEESEGCGRYPGPHGMAYGHGRPGPACHYVHGCPGYGSPVMMVPVKIKTRYIYSDPLRREKEVVVEEWVEDEVVGRTTISRPRKSSKTVAENDGKTTRSK